MHNLASLTSFGIWGWLKSLSITTPLIKQVSSNFPPTYEVHVLKYNLLLRTASLTFVSILINSKLTSFFSMSATDRTASTAISANCSWHRLTILEPKVVFAVRISISLIVNDDGIRFDQPCIANLIRDRKIFSNFVECF